MLLLPRKHAKELCKYAEQIVDSIVYSSPNVLNMYRLAIAVRIIDLLHCNPNLLNQACKVLESLINNVLECNDLKMHVAILEASIACRNLYGKIKKNSNYIAKLHRMYNNLITMNKRAACTLLFASRILNQSTSSPQLTSCIQYIETHVVPSIKSKQFDHFSLYLCSSFEKCLKVLKQQSIEVMIRRAKSEDPLILLSLAKIVRESCIEFKLRLLSLKHRLRKLKELAKKVIRLVPLIQGLLSKVT